MERITLNPHSRYVLRAIVGGIDQMLKHLARYFRVRLVNCQFSHSVVKYLWFVRVAASTVEANI